MSSERDRTEKDTYNAMVRAESAVVYLRSRLAVARKALKWIVLAGEVRRGLDGGEVARRALEEIQDAKG